MKNTSSWTRHLRSKTLKHLNPTAQFEMLIDPFPARPRTQGSSPRRASTPRSMAEAELMLEVAPACYSHCGRAAAYSQTSLQYHCSSFAMQSLELWCTCGQLVSCFLVEVHSCMTTAVWHMRLLHGSPGTKSREIAPLTRLTYEALRLVDCLRQDVKMWRGGA